MHPSPFGREGDDETTSSGSDSRHVGLGRLSHFLCATLEVIALSARPSSILEATAAPESVCPKRDLEFLSYIPPGIGGNMSEEIPEECFQWLNYILRRCQDKGEWLQKE